MTAEAAQALRSLASRQPLLLILEDIQFATEAEIDLLTRLAAALSDSPILLLLSYRDEDNQPGSLVERLGRRLDGSGHPQPLRLGGLDDNALLSTEGEKSAWIIAHTHMELDLVHSRHHSYPRLAKEAFEAADT